jgi:hypothetical protein
VEIGALTYTSIASILNSQLSDAVTPTEPSRPGNKSLIRSHWSSRNPNHRIGQLPS